MESLFEPGKIGGLQLNNRLVHSATYEGMAQPDGGVSPSLIKRYRHLARGGAGLIIPGYMNIGQGGRAQPFQTGIHQDAMLPGLSRLVRVVHENGSKIVFQIAHGGTQTNKALTGGTRPMGPSSLGYDVVSNSWPRAMEEKDMEAVISAFGQAARRAVEAGADGVQLHAAHGYLINQFLSPFFNRRRDSWGGSPENRFRFLARVVGEVRAVLPAGMPLLVKLNTHDHTAKPGITPELAAEYAARLAALKVDAIELSAGTVTHSFMNICRGEVPVKSLLAAVPLALRPLGWLMLRRMKGKYEMRESYNRRAAEVIKPKVGELPLILVGGNRRGREMAKLLESGPASFISMSRPFIREPYLVKRMEQGRSQGASCVSCNQCFAAITQGVPVRCFHRKGEPEPGR